MIELIWGAAGLVLLAGAIGGLFLRHGGLRTRDARRRQEIGPAAYDATLPSLRRIDRLPDSRDPDWDC